MLNNALAPLRPASTENGGSLNGYLRLKPNAEVKVSTRAFLHNALVFSTYF